MTRRFNWIALGLVLVLRRRRVRPGTKVSAADQALVEEALR